MRALSVLLCTKYTKTIYLFLKTQCSPCGMHSSRRRPKHTEFCAERMRIYEVHKDFIFSPNLTENLKLNKIGSLIYRRVFPKKLDGTRKECNLNKIFIYKPTGHQQTKILILKQLLKQAFVSILGHYLLF